MPEKPRAPRRKKPAADPDWGTCDVCGALTAWPGAGVSCDMAEEDGPCDGTILPSDEDGKPL